MTSDNCKACALGKSYNDGSCFTRDELICMIESWNSLLTKTASKYKHNGILDNTIQYKSTWPFKELWRALSRAFNLAFETKIPEQLYVTFAPLMDEVSQVCPSLADAIRYYSIKPAFSGGVDKWLSNTDIDAVMRQMTYRIKDLKFEGAFPADYLKLYCRKLSNSCSPPYMINYDGAESKKWACILNTDTSGEKGEHWVALYKNSAEESLEYYDSEASEIPERMAETIAWLANGRSLKENTIRSQYDDYNCGVFSIFYIIYRSLGVPLRYFQNNKIQTENIEELRDLIFS